MIDHSLAPPIRSATVLRNVRSWKLLLVESESAPAPRPRIRSSSRSLYGTENVSVTARRRGKGQVSFVWPCRLLKKRNNST